MRWKTLKSRSGNDDDTAALWAVRRSRGLSASEEVELARWLSAGVGRAEAMARQEATLQRMGGLAEWQPRHSAKANPDLFAPPQALDAERRRARFRIFAIATSLAAAAAIAISFVVFRTPSKAPSSPAIASAPEQPSFLRIAEKQALPDGSILEIRDGTRFTLAFTAAERRVRLLAGEVYCQVAKDAHRPFVVESAGASVTATGTQFSVRSEPQSLAVLVTEGAIRMASQPAPAASGMDAPPASPIVHVGQLATVGIENGQAAGSIEVREASLALMDEALGWRAPRLQFYATPLATAVAQFNQHAGAKLVVADSDLAAELVGGTFRVDRVDSFVRMVAATLDVRVEQKPNGEVILHRAK